MGFDIPMFFYGWGLEFHYFQVRKFDLDEKEHNIFQ